MPRTEDDRRATASLKFSRVGKNREVKNYNDDVDRLTEDRSIQCHSRTREERAEKSRRTFITKQSADAILDIKAPNSRHKTSKHGTANGDLY